MNIETPIAVEPSSRTWSRAQRIAFRFAFVFTSLSCLQLSYFIANFLFFGVLTRPVQSVLIPLATAQGTVTGTLGWLIISRLSGDPAPLQDLTERHLQTFLVVSDPKNTRLAALATLLGFATVASVVTIIWSLADRRRSNYETLYRWMRVTARYMLALVAMVYAMVKVVPTQFGFLAPGELLRPIGQLSKFLLLWHFMAASTLYTVFTGLVELLGVTLLFFRRTTPAGALLLGAALANVAVIDVGYRVGAGAPNVLLLLLALDLIVLVPYIKPVASFLFLGRAAVLPPEPGLSSRPWRHSALVSALVVALLVSVRAQDGFARRRTYFGAGHPVWGLFDVESFTRNGAAAIPLWSDQTAWRRIATGSGSPPLGRVGLAVQFANGDIRPYQLVDDAVNHTWRVRQGANEIASLRYTIDSGDAVTLGGRIGQDTVQMHLRRADPRVFPLFPR